MPRWRKIPKEIIKKHPDLLGWKNCTILVSYVGPFTAETSVSGEWHIWKISTGWLIYSNGLDGTLTDKWPGVY